MDPTKRQITKIAREVSSYTVHKMKDEGIGTAEFDFIHAVRHHPGITQSELRDLLKIDKGAAARRAASLEAKGYLVRQDNPDDGRSQLLYATDASEDLKNSKAKIEAVFYEWLLSSLSDADRTEFCRILDVLYQKVHESRRNGFPEVSALLDQASAEGDDSL